MLHLIIGGSASGKSAFAERCLSESASPDRIYLATMRIWDAEGERRAARHRALRAGKGFRTVEAPAALASVLLPHGCAVLVEDLGNLLTNELFLPDGSLDEGAADRILRDIHAVCAITDEVILVTNDVFAEQQTYSLETACFVRLLGQLHRQLATEADRVTEVVCGIPVTWKGCAL